MAVKNLLIRGGADFSGIKKEMDKTQKTLSNFQSNVGGTMKKIGALLGGLAVGKLIKDSTQMAMGVESAIGNINRNMGTNAKAFQNWVNTQAQGYGIAKADAYKYGGTFSNLLSSFTKDAKETADQTTELMKAAAIISSKTGRSYEDTADRIRSGMLGSTEAIEDLGVYTNISMIESTEAFKKFANGKSWSQLDFQTQQQIRLAAILEQTYARYGTELANTTQTAHAQFIASLKNIQLSLGQAFMPIYSFVLPALTAMANAIGALFNYIAQFTTALFGKAADTQKQAQATTQQAKATAGLGNATEKAGKKAKKAGKEASGALASFDEINQFDLSKGGSDSGDDSSGLDGAGAAMPAMDIGGFADSTVEVSNKIKAMADNVKNIFSTIFEPIKISWDKHGKGVTEEFKRAVDGTKETLSNFGRVLASIWDNGGAKLVENIASLGLEIGRLGLRIYNDFILLIVNWFINILDPETNRGMKGVLDGINGMLEGITNFVAYLAGDGFYWVQTFLGLFTAFKTVEFVKAIAAATIAVGANTVETMKNVTAKMADKAETLILLVLYAKDAVVKGTSALATGIMTGSIWKAIAAKVADKAETLVLLGLYAKDAVAKALSTAATATMTAATTVWNTVAVIATTVTKALGVAIAFLTSPIGIAIAAIAAIIAIGISLYKHWDFLKAKAAEVWDGIKVKFGEFKDWLGNVFATDWSNKFGFFGNTLNSFLANVRNIFSSVEQVFGGLIDFIAGVFTGDWSRAWSGVVDIFGGIFDSLVGLVKVPLNYIIDAINFVIRGLNKLSINIPDWVPGVGGKTWGINIPNIPKLAKGGITNGPTMALIGDNPGGKEVVSPLDKLQDMLVSAVGTAMLETAQFNSNNSNNGGDIYLQVDGTTFARLINPYNAKENQRLGNSVIIQAT